VRETSDAPMPPATPETQKLLAEYTALAPAYDRRWSVYLDASLSMAMELVANLNPRRVLDVACGTGQLLEMLAVRLDQPLLFGIDRVPAMLDVARQRLAGRATLLEGDAEKLQFDDACFELVTCTSSLHYFPDPGEALQECRRVISSSGTLIITDWCRDYAFMKLLDRILPWTRHAHAQTLSLGELEQCLATAGFRVVRSSSKKIDWFWGLMSVSAVPA